MKILGVLLILAGISGIVIVDLGRVVSWLSEHYRRELREYAERWPGIIGSQFAGRHPALYLPSMFISLNLLFLLLILGGIGLIFRG
jgi:hypothetical protein